MQVNGKTLRVDWDDTPSDFIDPVNEMLSEYGLKFEWDRKDHDGFELYKLIEIEKES